MNHTLNFINELAYTTLSSNWLASWCGSTDINKCVYIHGLSGDEIDAYNTIGIGFGPEWGLTVQTLGMGSSRMLEQVHILVHFSQLFDTNFDENTNFGNFGDNIQGWISEVLLGGGVKPSEVVMAEGFELSEYANKVEKLTATLSIKLPYMVA